MNWHKQDACWAVLRMIKLHTQQLTVMKFCVDVVSHALQPLGPSSVAVCAVHCPVVLTIC